MQRLAQGATERLTPCSDALVKRSLLTGALVCVVGLLVGGGPALSLRPYRPEPVNFSMAAPAGAILGSAARQKAAIVSRPLRAPRRFNLVGLSWRGREREVGDSGSRPARWRALDPLDAAGIGAGRRARPRRGGATGRHVQPDLGR